MNGLRESRHKTRFQPLPFVVPPRGRQCLLWLLEGQNAAPAPQPGATQLLKLFRNSSAYLQSSIRNWCDTVNIGIERRSFP